MNIPVSHVVTDWDSYQKRGNVEDHERCHMLEEEQ